MMGYKERNFHPLPKVSLENLVPHLPLLHASGEVARYNTMEPWGRGPELGDHVGCRRRGYPVSNGHRTPGRC